MWRAAAAQRIRRLHGDLGSHNGATGSFWPVWVLIVFVVSVVRNGWALYGPAPDLDAVESQLDARRAQRLARGQRRTYRRGGDRGGGRSG